MIFLKNFIEISSKDNQIIKLVNQLKKSNKTRKDNGLFVLEGLRICKDAFENGIEFSCLIVSENAMKKYINDILAFIEISKKCYIMSDELFKKIADTVSPQGIISVAKIPDTPNLPIKLGKYIALENLQDPSNLGAVARSAEALGINGVIINEGSCDPFSPKALRSSMGTLLRIPLYITDDILKFSKNNGLRVISTVVDKTAQNINSFKFKNGDVLVIGNEGNGITDYMKENSDVLVTIPMSGNVESLNASVAAAISMWEMMK